MSRSDSKAERLLQLEQVLLAHQEGLSKAEIARKLGVHRSTAGRYIDDLSRRLPIWEDGNLVGIDRDDYLTHVRLTIHESMAVHLAARLMATRTDKHNPHAASALRKLGSALEAFSPQVSRHLLASADVMDDAARRRDPVYLDVLEKLTRAWSDGRMVRVCHRLESGQVYEYDFAPYFIEPYAVGRTSHVIGWREPPGAIRTFKIERVQQAEVIKPSRPYTIPEDFDPRETLADAWGIWYTEAEPVEVVLRFHPRVVHRVKETRWHRSERVEEQPDGSLLWRAEVAEPQEMLPWIRGWGADVEVLAPDRLREVLVKEAYKMALLYQLDDVSPPPLYQRLWGKADRKTGQIHPLVCHMLDVAQVTLALWRDALTTSVRDQFANTLSLDQEAAGRIIAFWAGLHDLGKASPCFQRKYAPAQAELCKAGLPFPRLFSRESCPHGTISARVLESLLETETGVPRRIAKRIARAVGGHHGEWPILNDLDTLRSSQLGDAPWQAVRCEIFKTFVALFEPPSVQQLGDTHQENTFLTLLSGLVSTADWIGSIRKYFPYVDAPVDPSRYIKTAKEQARQTLYTLGWIGWQPPAQPLSFKHLFPFSPNSMQESIIALAQDLEEPSIVIIEAPTGSGKTESALYLADHWAHVGQQRGMYVAMPTMATSNQMFSRVREFLQRRYPDDLVNLHLIHSQSRWREDMQDLTLETFDEREGGTLAAMAWFLPHKRSLLASFGVGTVDQALLSVLQARHFFMRLFGLGHKTVIFDEVHAYDTYMSTIFQRLLSWLRAAGASVVVLSATLPARTRHQLLEAYLDAGEAKAGMDSGFSYPAVMWANENGLSTQPLPAPPDRRIALEWIEREPKAIAQRLRNELQDGGCAAVICNTVGRAQEVYRTLRDAGIVPKSDLILFHARFPFAWRDRIESRVLNDFGKEPGEGRPDKAIVVATQVIEQSLDLDFDLMVTDMAPVDLILQRAGRLHRHEREGRPSSLNEPRLLIVTPDEQDGLPSFGRKDIYEPYILLRSYLTLSERKTLALPSETVELIETVYGDGDDSLSGISEPLAEALEEAKKRMEQNRTKEQDEARRRLIAAPGNRRLMNITEALLEEEKPELHQALQALTRLIPPNISLVCLHRVGDGLFLEPDGSGSTIDVSQPPSPELTQKLARHTIVVSHWPILNYFRAEPVPDGWRKHALLHTHRMAVFRDCVCELKGTPYLLRLSRELGLEIVKDEKEENA
jgi:CRISPR-associated endonuclease/helicase Cas3